MRILVIGTGAREHALCASFASDPAVTHVMAAPGNPGMAQLATLHAVAPNDPHDVAALATRVAADFVVIGPEAPLVAGVADAVRGAGITCFGPSAAAAQLEGSKSFAKEIMAAAGVPTAAARVCNSTAEAAQAFGEFGSPYVVKADGLAAGKGVIVTEDRDAALAHVASCDRVVIEEYLDGPEVSLFVITDGTTAVPLLPAQDFKRIGDGDTGPNTGGMGAYAPLPWTPPGLVEGVMRDVVHPTLAELQQRSIPFSGLLYVGLALTARGPRVVEFNVRFGDPETQAVLALLEAPLAGLLHAAATGVLARYPALTWRSGAAVTLVMAAANYPGSPRTGDVILGLDEAMPGVHHAGTTRNDAGALVTSGGRVLSVTATGADLGIAQKAAYARAADIYFDGEQHRTDIATKAIAGLAQEDETA